MGIWSGCLNDVSVHDTIEKARGKRDALLREYFLTDEDVPDNQHNPDRRWNDEAELHVHAVTLETEREQRETLLLAMVQEAFTYALGQIQADIERRLVTQEFWHSLNRKGLVSNHEVSPLIDLTLQGVK